MCAIPEDRQRRGLILDFDISENMILEKYDKEPFSYKGRINREEVKKYAKEIIGKFDIRPIDETSKAGSLSGGNQQKVVISKWLAAKPDVLILDEPTRGIDVGAKAEIYKLMQDLAAEGVSIIMISSELPEIINNSSRIAVMNEGRLVKILDPKTDESTQEIIMSYAVEEGVEEYV